MNYIVPIFILIVSISCNSQKSENKKIAKNLSDSTSLFLSQYARSYQVYDSICLKCFYNSFDEIAIWGEEDNKSELIELIEFKKRDNIIISDPLKKYNNEFPLLYLVIKRSDGKFLRKVLFFDIGVEYFGELIIEKKNKLVTNNNIIFVVDFYNKNFNCGYFKEFNFHPAEGLGIWNPVDKDHKSIIYDNDGNVIK